jgi:Sulfotransferase domain
MIHRSPQRPPSTGERSGTSTGSSVAIDVRLPDFVVIGAMKAGTTSLFEYLRVHPDVFMSPIKEVDFFVREINWSRGLEWYARQFERGRAATAVGEASPSYTKYPEYAGVPERMVRLLPDARLIYLVRDPIERIRSHYQHRAMTGSEAAPIDVAVLHDPRYIDGSRYAMQLERYLRWYPRDRILLIDSEELKDDRVATMRRVHRFLGVDPGFVAPTIEREYYRTEERAGYPSYVWWLRRHLKRVVPPSKRWWLRRSLNRRLPDGHVPSPNGRNHGSPHQENVPRATIDPALRERLVEMLREDVMRLRAHMSQELDGWGIA